MNAPAVAELPTDSDALQALVRTLRGQVVELEQKLAWFTEQYRLAQHRRFAASSERWPEQLDLFAELLPETVPAEAEAESSAASSTPPDNDKPARGRGGRGPLPANLPRERVVHDVAEEEKSCLCCGQLKVVIGEERSEQLDIVAPRLKVIEHVRLKYACQDCDDEGVSTAAKPVQPIPKSLASPGLLAYLIIAKLVDGLPLYRQVAMFKRLGVELARQTLASWVIKAGELVWPLVNLLHDELLSRDIVQADETTLQVLKEPGRAAQTASYLWAYRSGCGPPILLFEYQPSRGGEHPSAYLEGFLGAYLQTDGYSGYDQVWREAVFEHVACWSHARRKYVEVVKARPRGSAPGLADEALVFIRALYRIERYCTEQQLSTEARLAYRQAHSRPIVEAFKAWLEGHVGATLPKSLLGKALHALRFRFQGFLPTANRLSTPPALYAQALDGADAVSGVRGAGARYQLKRVIKSVAIARKNFLFANSPAGAHAIANLFTLIETAKANGLEPSAYLRHVFTELPRADSLEAIEALLPWRCAEVVKGAAETSVETAAAA